MEHIIATTDLSPNSRAGMRLAVHLAQARKAKLTFLHIYQVLRASFWSDRQYEYYVRKSRETIMREMPAFIRALYRSMKMGDNSDYQIAVHHNLDTVSGILEYAGQNKASLICISTKGAGVFRRIIGTNTGRLVSTSPVPVLTVPSKYRVKPVRSLLYATDMTDYERELKSVVAFARPLQASIDMLHLSYPLELLSDKSLIEKNLEIKTGYPVKLIYKKRNVEETLLKEINDAVDHFKPAVLVLFTDQRRSFFERLITSSTARTYSFHAKVPLLSFRKQDKTE